MDFRSKTGLGLIIGLVVLLVVCGLCVFSGRLGNLFGGGGFLGGGDQPGELGRMYTALEVDQDGCPLEVTTQFLSDEPIFAGLGESFIPRGTTMFMRLYFEEEPIEDTEELHADQDLNTCVWFEFTPGPDGFEPGNYLAEVIVNGNPADSIGFEVVSASTSQGDLPATGLEDVQLGQAVTTTEIDQDGCSISSVDVFTVDEPVYVAISESFIPAGTELFASLIQDGLVIENTEPLVADQDMQTCIWFVFEGIGASSGLDPGQYTAELYINGQLVESLAFSVQ